MPARNVLIQLAAAVDASTRPWTVFLKLLAIIFVAEVGVMFLLPSILPAAVAPGLAALVDSCILTLFTGPLVWWVIIGPLRASAAAEKLAVVAQLGAGVAHELRNPLTAVKMLVQSHRETTTACPQLAEDLSIIEDEVRRMERSLQTFLDFARPRKPERRGVDPAEVVRRVLALVEPRARNQRVSMKLETGSTPLTVHADPEQLSQVVLNLCGNALDVMPNGGELQVRVEAVENLVRIRVTDTGPGIDPQVLPRLFQPFVTSKDTGVGLGLVTCQRIAQSHGGRVRGENTAHGACFTFELPLFAGSSPPSGNLESRG